jgi:flavin-binding protein dodecin
LLGLWQGVLAQQIERREIMSVGTYKIIELVGTSDVSWEEAAKNAVETASQSLRDLRIAEVKELDMKIEDGKVVAYRARLSLSFKYQADK